jgi:hypothetical protein
MIYLASPYSHPEPATRQRRFEAVCKVAADLMREDYVVFCPIAHSHPIEIHGGIQGGWDLWALQDLPLLNLATELHVACFPGWEQSEGVTAELRYFWQHYPNRKIVYHRFEALPA